MKGEILEGVSWNYVFSCGQDENEIYNDKFFRSLQDIWNNPKCLNFLRTLPTIKGGDYDELAKIKDAIDANNFDVLTKVDIMVFAKSRPYSMELLNGYFDSLYSFFENFALKRYSSSNDIDNFKKRIRHFLSYEKRFISCVYYLELCKSNVDGSYIDILNMLGLDLNAAIKLLENMNVYVFTGDDRIDSNSVINNFIGEYFFKCLSSGGDYCKRYMYDKYHISNVTFNKFLKKFASCNEQLYRRFCALLSNSCDTKLDGILNKSCNLYSTGIDYNNQIISFTILDYYYLSGGLSINYLMNYIKNKYSGGMFDENFESFCRKFSNLDLGKVIYDKNQILNTNLSFEFSSKIVNVDNDMVSNVFDLFKKHNIPLRFNLIQIALSREASGIPIFPLEGNGQSIEKKVAAARTLKA